jgi:hypothetical protein
MITESKAFAAHDLVIFESDVSLQREACELMIVTPDAVYVKHPDSRSLSEWLTREEFINHKPVKVGYTVKKWFGRKRIFEPKKS